jgi:hypothetical protein
LASDRGVRIYAKRAFVHTQYNEDTYENDIAIIQLQQTAAGITPIALDTSTNDWQSGSGRVLGWGKTSGSGSNTKKLRHADLPIVSDNDCKKKGPFDKILKPSQVCAGYVDGRSGTCVGDSGGPLTVGKTLIGLTSYGAQGCGTYSAYTQLNKYQSFISDTLRIINDNTLNPPTTNGCRCDATGVTSGAYCSNWLKQEYNWCYTNNNCPGAVESGAYPGKYWFKCVPGRSAKAQALDDANRNGNIYVEPSEIRKEFGSTSESEASSSDIGAVAGGAIGAGVMGLGCAALFVAQHKRNSQKVAVAADAERIESQLRMAACNPAFDI